MHSFISPVPNGSCRVLDKTSAEWVTWDGSKTTHDRYMRWTKTNTDLYYSHNEVHSTYIFAYPTSASLQYRQHHCTHLVFLSSLALVLDLLLLLEFLCDSRLPQWLAFTALVRLRVESSLQGRVSAHTGDNLCPQLESESLGLDCQQAHHNAAYECEKLPPAAYSRLPYRSNSNTTHIWLYLIFITPSPITSWLSQGGF